MASPLVPVRIGNICTAEHTHSTTYNTACCHTLCKNVKGKFHLRTDDQGPDGEQRYSSTLSLTSALDRVRGQCHVPAAVPLGKRYSIHCTGGWVTH